MSAASAISTNAISGTKRPSSCFRISLSPHARLFRLHVVFEILILSPALYCRGRNLLHYFTRKRLAQTVLQRLLENDGVASDFHHVTVEYRVVLPQKISFIQ